MHSALKTKRFQIRLRTSRTVATSCAAAVLLFLQACSERDLSNLESLDKSGGTAGHRWNVAVPDATARTNGDDVLVKFNSSSDSKSRARSLEAAGLSEVSRSGLVPGLVRTRPQAGVSRSQTLLVLRQQTNVVYAEPDYLVSTYAVPNDPQFAQQYGLDNTAQTGGVVDADIDAPEAWDIQSGADTVIAVIDTGVDYNHPDLRNNIWSNPGEIPNNRIDDDGNGYVDDIRGWNFVNNNNDPMDQNNHGTHVSGIIAAQGNNSTGVVGVNWRAKIMPLRFMDANGVGATSDAIRAVQYAVANGARVSNNSWGGNVFSQALFDAIQAANSQGHLFVAAAGNDTVNTDNTPAYPSSYNLPNIISVAASDARDGLSTFSNFGVRSVDLAAPGTSILSTIRGATYRQLSGTSMATPFVTGVAGLVLSQNPNILVSDLRNAIIRNVDPVATLSGRVATGGRVNAFKAVQSVAAVNPTPTNPTPTNPSPTPTNPSPTNPTPVQPPPVSNGLSVRPAAAILAVGNTQIFAVSGGQAPYTWSVASTIVGSIDQSGKFVALTLGTTQITVRDSTTRSATLNVEVTGLAITPTNVSTVPLNGTVTFTAKGGTPPYNWTVNNASIATMNIQGTNSTNAVVTAITQGTFVVTLVDSGGKTTTSPQIKVVVNPLAIEPIPATIQVGSSVQLSATGGTSPYTWASSNSAVASVDNGGLVTGVRPGSATISATDAVNTVQSASITVVQPGTTTPSPSPTPTPTPPGGGTVFITPAQVATSVSGFVSLSAGGGTGIFTWNSANPAIAIVDTTGLVTGIAPGTTTVTATDSAGVRGTATVDVRQVNVTPATGSVGAGGTLQLSASGGAAPYSWRTGGSTLASVDANGLVTGIAAGTVTITATDIDGFMGSATITVGAAAATPAPGGGAGGGGGGGGGHH